jgi:hypothetical protein
MSVRDKMRLRDIIIGLLFLLFLFMLSQYRLLRDVFDVIFYENYELLITNDTNEEISQVMLKYSSSGKDKYSSSSKEVLIGIMKPNSRYIHIVDTNQTEESVLLMYRDYSGVKHEKVVIGYILKGYTGRTSFIIKN